MYRITDFLTITDPNEEFLVNEFKRLTACGINCSIFKCHYITRFKAFKVNGKWVNNSEWGLALYRTGISAFGELAEETDKKKVITKQEFVNSKYFPDCKFSNKDDFNKVMFGE